MVVNNNGLSRNRYVKKEGLKGLIIGPIYSLILLGLMYLSMSKWLDFFFISAPFLLVLMVFLFIVSPIKMLKRHNKTIKELNFNETEITFSVFPALWMKTKTVNVNKKLKLKSTKFIWYGKAKMDGFIIKARNKEYYLVLDYFDNKEFISENIQTIQQTPTRL